MRIVKKTVAAGLLIAVMLILAGCGKTYRDISLSSLEFVSITPRGESSGDALLRVGLNNPISAFELTDISAILKIEGVACVEFSTDQLMIAAKCDKIYTIPVSVDIPEGANIFELLNVLKSGNESDISLEVSARPALRGGLGLRVKRTIPLGDKINMGDFVSTVIGKSVKDLKITDLEICSIKTGDSRDSCEVLMRIGLNNPYMSFELSSLSGIVKLNGVKGINISDEDLTVISKGNNVYYITLVGSRVAGFNLCSLLNLLKNSGQPSLTADLSVRLAFRGGIGTNFKWKDIVLVSPK